MEAKKTKQRIILEITPDLVKKMNDLKKSIGASSNVELFRHALGLSVCLEKYRKQGYEIQCKKQDKIINIVFPL